MALAQTRSGLLVLGILWGCQACGGNKAGLPSSPGGAAGGSDAAAGTGVDAALGLGPEAGTVASGGGVVGSTGGVTGAGGMGTGGGTAGFSGTGGSATGGAATGGSATGGGGTGAVAAGGAGTAVVATGGVGSGGARTGGSATGGGGTSAVVTGGAGSGGTAGGGASGTIAGAFLEIDGHKFDFGNLVLGKTGEMTFTLTNRGTATSGAPVFTTETSRYPDGTPEPLAVSGCGAALAPEASCTLAVVVRPPKLGLFQAYVRIKATPGIEKEISILVQGWSIGFEVSPVANVDLGNLATGVVAQHVLTVTALVALSDLEVYANGDGLSVNPSATTCTAALAAGASCVLAVDFNAATVGWKRGVIGVRAGGSMGQIVAMQVTANVSNAADLAIAPDTPQAFVAYFEETTAPIVFTVTNLSDAASGPITPAIVGGEYARDFAISATDCTTLAPHATCTVSVVCSPAMSATTVTREAVLSVTDGNTHLAVPLSAEVTYRW